VVSLGRQIDTRWDRILELRPQFLSVVAGPTPCGHSSAFQAGAFSPASPICDAQARPSRACRRWPLLLPFSVQDMPPSHPQRVFDLDHAFGVLRMKEVWTRTVRTGLRRQTILDLHDYLDVHRNIDAHVRRIRSNIIAGTYRPGTPEVVRLEKRDGIARRLLIPTPSDALVLQTLVETFEGRLLASQPTANAFYSRSHVAHRVEDVDDSFAYPWWLLWPQFQERIWQFTRARQYLVVADLASYFDSIPLVGLRNIIASMGHFEEPLLDFLFFMLEAFVWRPFYMPFAGVGLPQIDFDAPRLIAHSYLYAADRHLEHRTGGDFVRWMDDINFGTDSISQARAILGELETLLNSYGLRLNTGKTKVLAAQDAAAHFWIQENRQLTIATNLLNSASSRGDDANRVRQYIRSRYHFFAERPRIGNWDKVLKRYLSLFGRFDDPTVVPLVPSLLSDCPSLRKHLFGYYVRLGYSAERLNHVLAFLTADGATDDASIFLATATLVEWEIPRDDAIAQRLVASANYLAREIPTSVAAVAADLWIVTKYGSALELEEYVERSFEIWGKSQWASRQIAAASPRLRPPARARIAGAIVRSGLHEGLDVLSHLDELRGMFNYDHQLRSYVFHQPSPGWSYPLGKVLLALSLLEGASTLEERRGLRGFLAASITDPYYRSILELGVQSTVRTWPMDTTARTTTPL
jgi:hypothetical protein